jgi:hypothetical protein
MGADLIMVWTFLFCLLVWQGFGICWSIMNPKEENNQPSGCLFAGWMLISGLSNELSDYLFYNRISRLPGPVTGYGMPGLPRWVTA